MSNFEAQRKNEMRTFLNTLARNTGNPDLARTGITINHQMRGVNAAPIFDQRSQRYILNVSPALFIADIAVVRGALAHESPHIMKHDRTTGHPPTDKAMELVADICGAHLYAGAKHDIEAFIRAAAASFGADVHTHTDNTHPNPMHRINTLRAQPDNPTGLPYKCMSGSMPQQSAPHTPAMPQPHYAPPQPVWR